MLREEGDLGTLLQELLKLTQEPKQNKMGQTWPGLKETVPSRKVSLAGEKPSATPWLSLGLL